MSGYLHWPILFCLFGLLFTAAELLRPARPLNYRAVIRSDLMALATYGFVLLPVSMYLSRALIKPELSCPSSFGSSSTTSSPISGCMRYTG
jgi:hypothetical protein